MSPLKALDSYLRRHFYSCFVNQKMHYLNIQLAGYKFAWIEGLEAFQKVLLNHQRAVAKAKFETMKSNMLRFLECS